MRIEVFGTGCAKCKLLEQNVRKAIEQLGINAEVVKVDDIETMVDRGLMATPGLAINGKIVAAGRIPSVDEIVSIVKEGS